MKDLFKHSGFTLIDLLVALSIVFILIGITAPSLQQLLHKTQATQVSRQLLHLLHFARNHAVNTAYPVIVCPSTQGSRCINDWSKDLIVFEDHNDDKRFNRGDIMLKKVNLIPENATLAWISYQSKPFVRYDQLGTTQYQNGRFYYCDQNQEEKRQLVVYRSGRVRTVKHEQLEDTCG